MLRRTLLKVVPFIPFLLSGKSAQASRKKRYRLNRFSIAGFQYYQGPQLIRQLPPDSSLDLIDEPNNSHDHYAVRIEWHGRMLGYVPRSDNRHISRLLRQGAELSCKVLENEPNTAPWRMLTVGVEMVV